MRFHSFAYLAAASLNLVACKSEAPPRESSDRGEAAAAVAGATAPQSLLKNDWAEAFTITLEPGQSLPPHDGPARVVYALTDFRLRYTEGVDSRDSSWRAGDVHAHAAGMHAIENIGATTAKLLFVARGASALPVPPANASAAPAGSTAPKADGSMTLRFDDDGFRVSEVRLPAGATLPRHPGLARVVYALSDYTIRYEADGAQPRESTFRAGDAHWHDADQHVIVNTGDTEAHFLIVQFKR